MLDTEKVFSLRDRKTRTEKGKIRENAKGASLKLEDRVSAALEMNFQKLKWLVNCFKVWSLNIQSMKTEV